jgi:predicted amidohydrolase
MTEPISLLCVGAVQTSPVFGDKSANRDEIENLLHSQEAGLWVLPELALTGYEFRGRDEAFELAEEVPNGESTEWLISLCKQKNCVAVMGIVEREGDKVYNACVMVGPNGMLGKYRKLHLFDKETQRFDPGDLPYPVIDIGSARVGMMICYDWFFPEAARTLALKGAQIIAHPTNLVMPYCQQCMRTRTLENHVFAITANRVGEEDHDDRLIKFTGRSQILSILGDTLAYGNENQPVCLTAEINPLEADNKMINQYNDLLKHRRPEFYHPETI